jgi:proteasome lid subunit RPN8/RPN11
VNTQVKRRIIELAEAQPDVEVCGFIYVKDGIAGVFPCDNLAADPRHAFHIAPSAFVACLQYGKPVAVYHSHPDGPAAFSCADPSRPDELGDLEFAEEMALPAYLYSLPTKEWLEYIPRSYRVPMEGREFCWGIEDCYATVRHYYRQNLGIYIRDYDRDETFQDADSNVIMENFEREGFVMRPPGEVRMHDVMVFRFKRAIPQHFGVFQGNSRVLWQLRDRLSHVDPLGEFWLTRLHCVLHHHTLP